MTDDLVKWLRDKSCEHNMYRCDEAADRIEQLEAALRKISQHDLWVIAIDALRPGERVTLEGKDD